MKKVLLVLVAVMLFGFVGKAQGLKVVNKAHYPITYCIGWTQGSSYYSSGWFEILPGEEKNIKNDDVAYMIYGQQKSGGSKEYVGYDCNLHIHPYNTFNIKNAHLTYVKNENPKYVLKNFIRVPFTKTKKSVFTFN